MITIHDPETGKEITKPLDIGREAEQAVREHAEIARRLTADPRLISRLEESGAYQKHDRIEVRVDGAVILLARIHRDPECAGS